MRDDEDAQPDLARSKWNSSDRKVQLLVGSFDREIVAIGSLIGTSCAKWWIGKHDVVATAARYFINRISQSNLWFEAVKIEIHQCETTRTLNQILPEVSGTLPIGKFSCLLEVSIVKSSRSGA